jgi:hypothetical protein
MKNLVSITYPDLMKKFFFLPVFNFLFMTLLGQTYVYDLKGNIISGSHIKTLPPEKLILTHPSAEFLYILDSTHIYVTAVNIKGDTLWRTDPWKDNDLMAYRTYRPYIVNFSLENLREELAKSHNLSTRDPIIWINYNNTQFGFINCKDGKFFFLGQD